MKKILTVSLLAVMAVSGARADIASTTYVDDVAATKQGNLQNGDYTVIDGNKVNVTVNGKVEANDTGLVTGGTVYAVTSTKVDNTTYNTKMGELDQAIEKIQDGELNITKDAVGSTEIKDKSVALIDLNDEVMSEVDTKINTKVESLNGATGVADADSAAFVQSTTQADGTVTVASTSFASTIADDVQVAPQTGVIKKYVDDKITGVGGDIETVISGLDGSSQDGADAATFTQKVVEADGIVTETTYSFASTIADGVQVAPQTGVIKKYVDDNVGAAVSTINSNVSGKQTKSSADFQVGGEQGTWFNLTDSLPAGCKAANSECSLVSVADAQGNVQIKWSVVVKGNPASADIAVVTPTDEYRVSD